MSKKKPTSRYVFETDVRNLLRQHFYREGRQNSPIAAARNASFWKELQTIRRLSTSNDIIPALTLVEGNKYYPFQGIGNTFPKDPKRFIDSRLAKLTPLPLRHELDLQVARINFHKCRLHNAFASLSDINKLIAINEWDPVTQLIESHIETFGLSLAILKKMFLASLHEGSLSGLVRRYRATTSGYPGTAYSLFAKYVYDFTDPTFDPTKASRYWTEQQKHHRAASWWSRILESNLVSYPASKDEAAEATLRISALSISDLCIYLWRLAGIRSDWTEINEVWSSIDPLLHDLMKENFSHLEVQPLAPYSHQISGLTDKEAIRIAFIFDEYRNVSDWIAEIQLLHNQEHIFNIKDRTFESKNKNIVEACQRFSSNFYDTLDLLDQGLVFRIPFAPEVRLTNHDVLFSLVVAKLFDDETLLDPEQMTQLIVRSSDLQYNLSTEAFIKIKQMKAYQASPVVQFLVSELQYRKERTGDHELERRLCFMRLFPDNRKESILCYIKATSNISLGVFLSRLCNRSFLEKLFTLMSSVKDVLETRLNICKFLTETDSKYLGEYSEEIDALTRELENLDAQSDLDSTRIHVDEDALREWFVENHQASVSRYTQTVLAEGRDVVNESMLSYLNRPKQNDEIVEPSAIGSNAIIIEIFETTFSAFASDKMFGLDSYLSRRIRHGTLRGHLITPLDRAIRRFEEGPLFADLSLDEHLKMVLATVAAWRADFLIRLDGVRRDTIQIRSHKSPSGLIQATWLIVANVAYLDAMVERVRERVIETSGDYNIFPDLYALCWDCLEFDLSQLRLYMTKTFLSDALSSLRSANDSLPFQAQVLFSQLFDEMQDVLSNRVREVCGWFIRPVFRRDSYSLRTLINTIFSTTKDLDDTYKFSEKILIDADKNVNRGGFEVFWEFLFVLIGNAARHGVRDEEIVVTVNKDPSDEVLVHLAVTSRMRVDTAAGDLDRIRRAFSVSRPSELATAAVEEGGSGLRKLIGLFQRIKYPNLIFFPRHNMVEGTISFHASIPTVIMHSRGSL